MDEEVRATFAAAVDTIIPGSSSDGVHELVAEMFDHAMPNYPYLIHSLLDAFASEVSPGATFASLEPHARGEVFKIMMGDASVDVRDVVDGLFLFTLGQTYSERHPRHQQIWDRIGYHGPSEGVSLDA